MTRARPPIALACAIGLAIVVAACSSSPSGGGAEACPNNLPPACPDPAPSYASTVSAIIAARCTKCHGPGGAESSRDFTSYAIVNAQRSMILDQVFACNMPPAGEAQPTTSEREALLGWLVCKAPDN